MNTPHDALPLFRDGERLTAERLNGVVAYLHDAIRRTHVSVLGPGVAVGLELGASGRVLTIAPGVAIDRTGVILRRDRPIVVDLDDDRDDTSRRIAALPAARAVRIGLRARRRPEVDPCGGHHAVDTHAELVVESLEGEPPDDLLIGHSAVEPWAAFPRHAAIDGSITLGWLLLDGALRVSMSRREGIAARLDALQTSLGVRTIELRAPSGDPQVRFVAPAGGADVQATRIAPERSPVAAATFTPSAPHVLLAAGGSGVIAPGLAGTIAIPLELDESSEPVDGPGVPIELAGTPATEAAVRVLRARAEPQVPLGLSAGASYAAADRTTVVPIATSGLVRVTLAAAGDVAIPAGTPLAIADAARLRPARAGDVIVARSAQHLASARADASIYAWVLPATPWSAPPSVRVTPPGGG